MNSQTTNEITEIYKQIVAWGVPLLLLTTMRYLQKIADRLTAISESLAVVVVQIEMVREDVDKHDERIASLEKIERRFHS